MTLNYDTSGVGQNGVAATHMLPAATLTQYSRHYSQALPGYSVPGTPWVAPYLVQTAPPHMQQVDVSFCTLFVSFLLLCARAAEYNFRAQIARFSVAKSVGLLFALTMLRVTYSLYLPMLYLSNSIF